MVVDWGSLHVHSRFSAKDGLGTVPRLAEVAQSNGYGALGLTDHGVIAGIFSLYRECRKRDIIPVPGCEMYVAFDRRAPRPVTWHMGVLATTSKGWDNLLSLVNLSHRQHKYKPMVDLSDLQLLGSNGMLDGLWATTGCFFGILVTALRQQNYQGTSLVAASNIVRGLQKCFGDRVLMELQHHAIEQEDHNDEDLVAALVSLSDHLSVPTIITSDTHYPTKDMAGIHETLKKLSSWSNDPDEAVFPGNGYWLPTESFMRRRFEPVVWDKAKQGFDLLVGEHDMKVPEIDTFTLKVPKLQLHGRNPDQALREMTVYESTRHPGKRYTERLADELDVVSDSGFSSYLLLAQEVTNYCIDNGVKYLVRGSASGSLICYLLGITQFDPLKWRLSFERFLSRDRSKPPDVDIDVEHTRRQHVIDHLETKYAVAHIGTWRELADSGDDEANKGSVWVKWHTYAKKTGAVLTNEMSTKIRALAGIGAFDGIGVHAAGLLIAPGPEDLARVPMQYIASSNTLVCALDKDEIESLGYVKLDVLGLKTLTALKEMEESTGVIAENIPLKDDTTMTMIRKGLTEGVFQLNGRAQQRGLPRLKPKRFADIVIALALFRPAVMNSGAMDDYLSLRNGQKRHKPHHEVIERHVAPTYGVILFQEQVLSILRDVGLDPETVNVVLKAVKASNAAIGDAAGKMTEAMEIVKPLCDRAGFSTADYSWLANAMRAYAAYGFNMTHAVAYAHMAWRTAWYKRHHPLDYWAAILRAYHDDKEKMLELRVAMKEEGHTLLAPHVNHSGYSYTIDRKRRAIRAGLLSIKGVGSKAAADIERNAPYSSLMDLAKRTGRPVTGRAAALEGHSPDSCGGVIKALNDAGALRGLVPVQLTLPFTEPITTGESNG